MIQLTKQQIDALRDYYRLLRPLPATLTKNPRLSFPKLDRDDRLDMPPAFTMRTFGRIRIRRFPDQPIDPNILAAVRRKIADQLRFEHRSTMR